LARHAQYEASEQETLFQWALLKESEMPQLRLLYHIPNGGKRNRLEAARLKRQGVKSGVPDLCLPVARGKYHGLYIELKYGKNKTSKNQNDWLFSLQSEGYAVAVCVGWEEASEKIIKYLQLGENV
jgi:hypothetical protein